MSQPEASLPRPEFPRPDFERSTWLNLNGVWEFEFDDENRGETARWYRSDKAFSRTILVPFCYQSSASGLGIETEHEIVWYRRRFDLPESFKRQRTLLKFGAVDYRTKVWVNGELAADHSGGHTPFFADVTELLRPQDNVVVVRAEDSNDPQQPRGKQTWRGERFGCWYTSTTGIWQTVWLESVGKIAIDHLRITPLVEQRAALLELELDGFEPGLELTVGLKLRGKDVGTHRITLGNRFPRLTVHLIWDDDHDTDFLWSPDNPRLVELELQIDQAGKRLDQVKSYFGLRKISVQNGLILLNGVPFYQKLVLDQGYWPESLLTPPSDEALVADIKLAKEFGFNGARKHQKIEDPRYYYWADVLGFVVWGEMPSHYTFSPQSIQAVTSEWQAFLKRDYNHPCIFVWLPINESWGVWNILTDRRMQDFSRAIYRLTKALDASRLVSSNDGWEQVESDLCAIHDYEDVGEDFSRKVQDKDRYLKSYSDWRMIYAEGSGYSDQPVLLTEFGGIAFDDKTEGWGYRGKVRTEKEFLDRFEAITSAVLNTRFIQGFCYTQLTDVQQEINGLLTPDRKPKIATEKIRRIVLAKR